MGGFIDNNPYSIESPQGYIEQYSADIEWDWSSNIYPSGNEEVFKWENGYVPVIEKDGQLVTNHVWKRFKIGNGGWSLPTRISNIIEQITVEEVNTKEGVKYKLKTIDNTGIELESNLFTVLQEVEGKTPIIIEDKTIKHSDEDGYRHIPSGGNVGQILAKGLNDTYKWIDNIENSGSNLWEDLEGTVPNISIFPNDVGYITSYIETDPVFTAWDKSYNDLIDKPTYFTDGNSYYGLNIPTISTIGTFTVKSQSSKIIELLDVNNDTLQYITDDGNIYYPDETKYYSLNFKGIINKLFFFNISTNTSNKLQVEDRGSYILPNYTDWFHAIETEHTGEILKIRNSLKEWVFDDNKLLLEGNQLITEQQPAILNATGSPSGTDASIIIDLINKVNELLDMLRTHGLIQD